MNIFRSFSWITLSPLSLIYLKKYLHHLIPHPFALLSSNRSENISERCFVCNLPEILCHSLIFYNNLSENYVLTGNKKSLHENEENFSSG